MASDLPTLFWKFCNNNWWLIKECYLVWKLIVALERAITQTKQTSKQACMYNCDSEWWIVHGSIVWRRGILWTELSTFILSIRWNRNWQMWWLLWLTLRSNDRLKGRLLCRNYQHSMGLRQCKNRSIRIICLCVWEHLCSVAEPETAHNEQLWESNTKYKWKNESNDTHTHANTQLVITNIEVIISIIVMSDGAGSHHTK